MIIVYYVKMIPPDTAFIKQISFKKDLRMALIDAGHLN